MTAIRIRNHFTPDAIKTARHKLYRLNYAPKFGAKIYYFLLVEPLKEKAFLKAMAGTDTFNIKQFGTIVASGYGEPSEDVMQRLRDEYDALV